jgi:hypothetical protein
MTTPWTAEAVGYGLTQAPTDTDIGNLIQAGAQAAWTDMTLRTLRLRFRVTAETMPDALARSAEKAAALIGGLHTGMRLVDLRVREEAVPTDDSHLMGYTRLGLYLGVSRQRAAKIAKANADRLPPYAHRDGYPLYTTASVDAFVQSWDRKAGRPVK